jgi:hypothetical protein
MCEPSRALGRHWTSEEGRELRRLAAGNTPTPLAAFKLGRAAQAAYNKAADLGVDLDPPNRSPYGTGGKHKR